MAHAVLVWNGGKRILGACCYSPVFFVSIHSPFLKLICSTYFNSLFPFLELRCHFINRASILHVPSFVLVLPHFWGHHSIRLCLTHIFPVKYWVLSGLCERCSADMECLALGKAQGWDFGIVHPPVLVSSCPQPFAFSPTDRWSFGVHRWLHAQLPLGAAAAEYQDQAGDGWSHVHIPSQVSNRAPHRWDKSESNNGGGCSLDCWTLLVLSLIC